MSIFVALIAGKLRPRKSGATVEAHMARNLTRRTTRRRQSSSTLTYPLCRIELCNASRGQNSIKLYDGYCTALLS